MKTYAEKRFFEWHEDELAVSLRAKSGSYGGGSEVLVVSYEECDRSHWRKTNVSAPLRVKEPYGGGEVLVLESNQNHARAEDTEVCPCLPAAMGNGGGYVPMIVEEKHELSEGDRLFKPRGASR